jgi:predicted phosphodiesterase
VQLGEIFAYVIHDVAQLDIDPLAAGVHVVISGHSHKPKIQHREGVLYINPGSAGRRRFKLPISLGELVIDGAAVVPRLATLVQPTGRDAAAFVRDA